MMQSKATSSVEISGTDPTLSAQSRDALSVLAFLLLRNQKAEKAYALLKALNHLLPANGDLLKLLGAASQDVGQPAKTLEYLVQCRPLVAGEDDLLLLDVLQSRALFALGRKGEADVLLSTALERRSTGRTSDRLLAEARP